METKKYVVICNEGTDFCSWTEEEPQTKQEIIDYFFNLGENEGFETSFEYYNFNYIKDIWNVTIREVETTLK